MTGTAMAQQAKVTTLMSKDLAENPAKEVTNLLRGSQDVHVVGRNASTTKPAKFLVVLVKDKGAPILTLVE